MKRLVFFAFILAGALFASASAYPNRVSWLPTTEGDILSYKRAEINKIKINLVQTNSAGGYYGGSIGSVYRWQVASWNLEEVTTNKIPIFLSRYFNDNDPGTNAYCIMVEWEAWYDSDGISCTFAPNGFWGVNQVLGTQVKAQSPMFTFPKVNGKPVIPAEAFNLSANWTTGHAGVPAIGKGIKWVIYRYTSALPSNPGFVFNTRNGACEDSYLATKANGFLYIDTGLVLGMPELFRKYGGQGTVTVWYDEGRTDGTEWNVVTGAKREIIPPQLSISKPENGLLKIAFSDLLSGSAYTLERSPMPNFATTNIVGTVLSDSNGVAVWYFNLALYPKMFFRARLAQSGETAH